jgi:predicted transcriptional regulator
MKARMTVSVERAVVEEVDRFCRRRKRTRSAVVAEALARWMRARQESELAAGYEAMAEENLRVAEENLPRYSARGGRA